ncbi:hypothetical protein [Serratia sp. M24T3]|uniref:transcriptional antitermination N peptide n=1 Tax=Serratia sp. M24T3 TaxID=932213 RepID=UPI0012F4C4A6|nr:hypothetical protein [Serratia sp. M24T3]
MMIKLHNIKANARSRRDEQRKAKQRVWATANPLLVGRTYQVAPQRLSLIKRAGYSPAPLKFLAASAKKRVKEYKMQIIRASYLFEYEFKRKPLTEGSICLPDVARFAAGHRKPVETVTAR